MKRTRFSSPYQSSTNALSLVRLMFTLVFIALVNVTTTVAQTTSFTYQGKLTDSGSPANGNYDLQFTLWDALSGGTQQPQPSPVTVTKSAVVLTNGVFTVQMDFGASAFPGANRWLETSVRLNGSNSFTLLSPRQPITSTPYAVRSANATIADTATSASNATQLGGVAAAQYVQTNDSRLSDRRSPLAGSNLYIQNIGLFDVEQSPASFNIVGNGVIHGNLFANRVGIGTTAPSSAIDVRDSTSSVSIQAKSTAGSSELRLDRASPVSTVAAQIAFYSAGSPDFAMGTSQGSAGASDFSIYNYVTASNTLTIQESSGNVGIGTTTPSAPLDVLASGGKEVEIGGGSVTGSEVKFTNDGSQHFSIYNSGNSSLTIAQTSSNHVTNVAGNPLMSILSSGNVGIGTTSPAQKLSVNGNADKVGGGSWLVFSDERIKNIKGRFTPGLKAVMQLQPLRYEYKPDNALNLKSEGEHIGFSAQAVQKIIPEAVTTNDRGYLLVNNDPILWTMLNAIKEQQKEIEQLRKQLRQLRASRRRNRR